MYIVASQEPKQMGLIHLRLYFIITLLKYINLLNENPPLPLLKFTLAHIGNKILNINCFNTSPPSFFIYLFINS